MEPRWDRRPPGAAGIAWSATGGSNVVGPSTRIQPTGRQLDPVGKLTRLGNFPTGGALTPNGRFLWTLSTGRGINDIRIVKVTGDHAGKIVQKIRMPGLSGGIAISRDGRRAYVSGIANSPFTDQAAPSSIPGGEGDVVSVFKLKPKSGHAKRKGTIPVPPPPGSPPYQTFPPQKTATLSWPRDLAVSPDGHTLLAALNLADRAAIIDTKTKSVRYVRVGHYPYGAAITSNGKYGLVTGETQGIVSVIDLATGQKVKTIQAGAHLSHPEGMAVDPKRPLAFVAIANDDQIGVINTKRLTLKRTLSLARPQGAGTTPTQVSVTKDGCDLLSADSGEDAVAVFALSRAHRCDPVPQGQAPGEALPARRSPARGLLPHRGDSALGQRQARLDLGTRAGRRAEPARAQPELPERLRRLHQQLPVPAVDRPGQLGHPALPERQEDPEPDAEGRPPDPPGQPAERACKHPDPGQRADQARLLHRQGEPHLRPGPGGRPARGRRQAPHPVRQADHPEHPRAGPALSAPGSRLRELRGLDRRPLLDRRRRGVGLRDEELAAELLRPRSPVRLRRLRGQRAAQGLHLPAGPRREHPVLQLRRGARRAVAVPRQGPDRRRDRHQRPGPQELRRGAQRLLRRRHRDLQPGRRQQRRRLRLLGARRRPAHVALALHVLQDALPVPAADQLGAGAQLHVPAARPHAGRLAGKAHARTPTSPTTTGASARSSRRSPTRRSGRAR